MSFITSKQSNQFCISAREGARLFLSLIAVISISFASNSFAQTLSGGAGGLGNGSEVGGSGGTDSIGGAGSPGGDSGNFGGGGGGGAGITGGNGGSGGVGITVPGTGGAAGGGAGGDGGDCSSCGSAGGAGGGGGGAGLYSNLMTTINNANLQGGVGGRGGYADGGAGGGGGGGAGGFGLIANSTSVTNNGTITGGVGGDGGNSSGGTGGNGGDGGVGVSLTNNSSLINSGTITGGIGGAGGTGMVDGSYGAAGSGVYAYSGNGIVITNSGEIRGGSTDAGAITNNAQSTSVINSNLIYGSRNGIYNNVGATISTIDNSNATAYINGQNQSILNFGTISTISNSGYFADAYNGIYNDTSGQIGSIINNYTGVIIATNVGLVNSGSVTTITNFGNIYAGGFYSISNTGQITTLNNLQGTTSDYGTLTYGNKLPHNYNVILGTSAAQYGQLTVTNAASWNGATGTTNFGIYSGSVLSNKYTAVLSGISASLLTSSTLSGSYISGGNSYAYSLVLQSGTSDIWDLLFPTYYIGPSVANTNQSLVNTASVVQGTYTLQNSVIANSFSYDCTVFGANNVCVSAGGRNTAVAAANGLNNTSALLIAAYRPHPNYRIGAYADQNLSVSNPGGTVNLGNNSPLIGLFGAWTQKFDGTGAEVKVSAAYGQKNTTITRSVVGSGEGASEAGSGSSTLNSQGAQVTAKYGFGILDNVIVSPYVGVRYTQNNMGGYTESTSSSVTAPLTYSALNTNATTALAGVGASYRVIPTVTTFASAGVESDTNTANGTYSATNSSIGTLTPVNFNANPVRTRPTATVGAYYDIEKNQRIGITGIYRQEAYQAVSTTAVMATYTIGL